MIPAQEKTAGPIPLYYHKTSGGAEYLTSKAVPGTIEGAFEGAEYIIRLDGAPELVARPCAGLNPEAAPGLVEALKRVAVAARADMLGSSGVTFRNLQEAISALALAERKGE